MSTLRHDQTDFNVLFVHSALDDAGLSVHAFRLYCHLARRAGKDGAAYPGGESMSAVCRMKRDTCFRAIRELEDRGMLVRRKREGTTNAYILTRASEWRTNSPVPNEVMSPETGLHPSPETGLQPSPETGRKGDPSKRIQKDNPLATATPSRGRRLDLAFEMLVKIQGSNLAELSKSERGKVNAALKSIREAMPSSTDENLATDIKRRARRYNEEMPNAVLTANALAAHWSRLGSKHAEDSLPKLPEPSWDWEYVVNRGELKINTGLPWGALPPEKQHRIVESYKSLPPLGYEFWVDDQYGTGWEEWAWPPLWHTLGDSDRGRARSFLSSWEPDGWREVWPDCFSAECPAEWSDVRERERDEVLKELRVRTKK